jgi:glycosyltransferase involved in cell wall biosynthesis
MEPLTIALVSEHASPLATLGTVDAGGQNVHVAALARSLAELGHQVVVHTRRDSAGLPEHVPMWPGVTVHHVDAGPPRRVPKDDLLPYMETFGDRLTEHWRHSRPDVVHAHFWMSGLAAQRGAAPLGLPVVQTYHALGTVKRRHQGAADTSPPSRIAVETAVGHGADRIIATCHDEVRELRAMGVSEATVRVVPCGVDPECFTPPVATPDRRRPFRLLGVGRLVPRKGTDVALAALALLPDAELTFVGGPAPDELTADPEAVRLRKIAAELGVADRFRMTGGVAPDRMPGVLRGADLVLCPARYEPFGIVPLEAMACAVPVVASAVGGHLDTVVDHRTGRLVPPGDPEALAAATADLLGDDELRAAYGAAGRRRVLAHFTWARVAARTEDVYRELVPAASADATEGLGVPAGARGADR